MSAAKKKKSVVRSSTEIFEHLWNGAAASSVSTQSEFVEEQVVPETQNNLNSLLPNQNYICKYENYISDESENSSDGAVIDFNKRLAAWFVESNVSNVHANKLLELLSDKIESLPQDIKMLKPIQLLISDACEKAVEKVEEKNKLILLRLTENVEGMRKEIIELKKAVSHNNATIIPSKPFANIEEFLNFEETILEDIDKFSLLKADLKSLSTSNSRKFVTKAWQKIMTDNVAESFSWRGTADKKCIRAFTVATAIRQTFAENGGKEEDFVFASKSYFQYAKNRIKIKTTKKVNSNTN